MQAAKPQPLFYRNVVDDGLQAKTIFREDEKKVRNLDISKDLLDYFQKGYF